MGEFSPLEIAAIVIVVGGLTALLLEIAFRSPRSLLDMIDDVQRFAEQPRHEAPPQRHAEKSAAEADSEDSRLAA